MRQAHPPLTPVTAPQHDAAAAREALLAIARTMGRRLARLDHLKETEHEDNDQASSSLR
jgi:hypothetical protein